MDTLVFVDGTGNPSTWSVEAAPPDRSRVGTMEHRGSGFYIVPSGPGAERIAGINEGPYATIDDCLDSISLKTGGICRKWQP